MDAPSLRLVCAAYGLEPLPPPLGLFAPVREGVPINLGAAIGCIVIVREDGFIAAGARDLGGLRFLISVHESTPDDVGDLIPG